MHDQKPSNRGVKAKAVAVTAQRGLLPWVFTLGLLAILLAWAQTAAARAAPESFADLAERLLPTVVNIHTSQVVERPQGSEQFEELFREFFERRGGGGNNNGTPEREQRRVSSLGSGFIIDPSGYIVTNNHVIDGADEISVRLSDDTILEAKLIGADEKTDLALLKVESDTPLVANKWGDSNAIRVGDWVMAIGNPFGLGGTVTAGIVSARQRNINSGPYDDYIQTDASINRGNSGGPMFNMDGEVIGVNTAIYSPSGGSVGIGFSIPSSMAANIIASLKEFGEVRRGWLGVRIQTVTEELAEGLRLPDASGALVASVTEGGPAETAGILQGDVILTFNGRKVPNMRNLPRMVAETPVGRAVNVVVWRKGKEVTVKVDLGKLDDAVVAGLPPKKAEKAEIEKGRVSELGLDLAKLSPQLRQEYQLDDKVKGVLVTEVDPDGTGAEKNLQPGDLVVEVDQEEVNSPDEVKEQVSKARKEGYRVVTLLVFRGGEYQWIAVRLKKDEG
ncbi:DegQ family serine endoprotease [Rhodovibrionaceae bacterium A322]